MSVSYEEILGLFEKNDKQISELFRYQQEVSLRFQDTDRKFQETDRQFKESDLRLKETERMLKELFRETSQQFQETDRRFKETDRRFQETERLVNRISQNLGDIGNRLGEFVEHMVAPAVVRLFRAQGIDVYVVYPGVEAKRNGEAFEVDLLVVNDGALIAVECKSKLREEHVDRHLLRLEKLKRVLPLYKEHRVMGAVAGMVIPPEVADYAKDRGLYVICQNGEQVDVCNADDFIPAIW